MKRVPPPAQPAISADPSLLVSSARRALAGYALSGFLAALPGALLPAWGHHLSFQFTTVGFYFLALGIGILLSPLAVRPLLARRGIAAVLVLASALASVTLAVMAFVGPPLAPQWRQGGLLLVGTAIGVLNFGLFQAVAPAYRINAAATVSIAGVYFGAGCLLAALSVGGTFYAYTVPQILLLVALVPACFAAVYRNTGFPPPSPIDEPTLRRSLTDFANPAAILLALLLFFQFGNEWSIAAWLCVYLIHRLGVSPESALSLLALYFLSLLVGRIASVAVLPRVPHGRILFSSAAAAMFGCILLLLTNNLFGAIVGVLLTGGGFATIYPLVAERIGHRFDYYQPGLFSGIFSLAMIGATLAPASLGFLADLAGMWVVMALPMAGTVMVVLLIGLIWLESKIGG